MEKHTKSKLFLSATCFVLCCIALVVGGSSYADEKESNGTTHKAVKGGDKTVTFTELQELPFTFYLYFVTCFTQGGNMNMDFANPEKHSLFWEEQTALSH